MPEILPPYIEPFERLKIQRVKSPRFDAILHNDEAGLCARLLAEPGIQRCCAGSRQGKRQAGGQEQEFKFDSVGREESAFEFDREYSDQHIDGK